MNIKQQTKHLKLVLECMKDVDEIYYSVYELIKKQDRAGAKDFLNRMITLSDNGTSFCILTDEIIHELENFNIPVPETLFTDEPDERLVNYNLFVSVMVLN